MASDISKIIGYIKNFKQSRMLLAMSNHGYFKQVGWLQSVKEKMPIDQNNNPIPWTTYSFIEFIKTYLTQEMSLFEYGSGNSSLFYAAKVKDVTCVEHNNEWYDIIKQKLPDNCTIHYRELTDDDVYSNTILESDKKYDIIIVDGRNRVKCIKAAIERLKENGLLVLDDAQRSKYFDGKMFLKNKGFKHIDFWGFAPHCFHNKNTCIFFRPPLNI